MTRSSRSLCTCLAVAAALSLAGQQLYGQATLVSSSPGDRSPVSVTVPRIPNNTGAAGYDFDTTLASSNYYTFVPNISAPPNPDVAVGPDDILAIVGNRVIARFPNPNAATTNPIPSGQQTPPAPTGCGWVTPGLPGGGTPSSTCTSASYGQPTSQAFLDVWLGPRLQDLCPTVPRTTVSCVISNASVRYDQMQGRFLVAFSVVDTGATAGAQVLTGGPQTTRRANWVLLVSRWAGLYLGSDPTTTQVFTTPNPPNDTGTPSTGGVGNNWLIYTSLVGGASEPFVPSGNINTGAPAGYTIPAGFSAPDCTAGATAPCYIPTDVRIGIDNDNVILTATVFNDNIPIANRTGQVNGFTNLLGGSGYTTPPAVTIGAPASGTTATAHTEIDVTTGAVTAVVIDNGGSGYLTTPSVTIAAPPAGETSTRATVQATISAVNVAFAGTRLRVYKKALIYALTSQTPVQAIVPGNAVGNGTVAPPANTSSVNGTAGFYDLFPFNAPWTLPGADPGTNNAIGEIFEPTQLRGRALASFSGNANLWGVTYLIGTLANAGTGANPGTGSLQVQQIAYTPTVFNGGNSTGFTGGVPYLQFGSFGVFTTGYRAPGAVPQAPNRDGTASAGLNVGDARPARAILREGLLYDARVGIDNLTGTNTFNPLAFSEATTIYDVINVVDSNFNANLAVARPPFLSLKTEWENGNFFSPMFDVPADVITYGSVSPINVLPYFDKLFVATTYPPLPPAVAPDTRGTSASIFSATTSQTVNGITTNYTGINNCRSQQPGVYTNMLSFPGLWDFRCGEDAYDTAIATIDPYSGTAATVVQYPTRGGAGNDPNNLSMWFFGAYARGRQFSILGPGQWGTHMANYNLSFPTTDPYNNPTSYYSDVPNSHPFFPYIQIARQTGIAPGGMQATSFRPDDPVNRAEMAYWVVRSQMDEQAITNFLSVTGGNTCSFQDVGCPSSIAVPTAAQTPTVGCTDDTAGLPAGCTKSNSPLWWRYIETMYRRGYTKGCTGTTDPTRQYCPAAQLKRQEMSVFLIRAKMNSVFPTVVSGANNGNGLPGSGDLFGMQFASAPYFTTDVPSTNPYFLYIQKMRELRITNGTGNTTFDPTGTLTRAQIATFVVRAFFI